jgi:predicted nucleic acid-binding protein
MAVIDASVYVALMNAHEAAHDVCWAWFERARRLGKPLRAPVLLLAEVAAALSRGVSDPLLAHQVVQQLVQTQTVELYPMTVELAEQAAGIAADCGIRGCDAVYVALAEQTRDGLVTLDRQQLERGRAVVAARRPGERL